MRRILLTAAGVAALTLTAPGGALAGQRHHHHHKRHSHHARVSFRHLGPVTASTVGPGVAPSTGSTPTTTAPTTTTPTTEENAGKVASYTGGVLTLTLNDGSTVSGKVTNNTRIECVSTTSTQPPAGDQDDEEGPGDDNGGGDDQSEGDRNQGGGWQDGQQPQASDQSQGSQQPQASDQPQGGDDNGGGDDLSDGGPISTEPPCDSSALVAGTIVRAAELRIAPGGTEFESIELVR